jgi:hypothetical protein
LFIACSGVIIICQCLYHSIKADTTAELLNQVAKEVTVDFHANYRRQWVDAVKKRSWWRKSKDEIIDELTYLIMEHQMVSNLVLSLHLPCQSFVFVSQPVPST